MQRSLNPHILFSSQANLSVKWPQLQAFWEEFLLIFEVENWEVTWSPSNDTKLLWRQPSSLFRDYLSFLSGETTSAAAHE